MDFRKEVRVIEPVQGLRDADGVVDRGRASLPGRLDRLVALDARADDRGGSGAGRGAERGQPVAVLLGDESLVRGVERNDRQVADPAAQLRVQPARFGLAAAFGWMLGDPAVLDFSNGCSHNKNFL